ncbi:MAG: polysaccharide deacetylase family protein, partial [Alphaproteobacteria bacterium]|nr:polysaccharide deacetylase family protein [Alphaproteobacteria bacterium]
MKFAYLTIDDSPSPHTDSLTDFLVERGVPAVLFCVGERIEANPSPIIRAIEKGMVIGNHS